PGCVTACELFSQLMRRENDRRSNSYRGAKQKCRPDRYCTTPQADSIMPVYFGFLDGALHALLDSLDGLEALLAQAVEKRDTYRLSRTIDSAHLATERLLKHVVAEVDPYLLLMSPNHEMLKVLRKAVV